MGNIIIDTIDIPTTKTKRTLRIYLPDAYETSLDYYPVLYMHDAQNLYDDHTSYGGLSWGVKETLDSLITDKKIPKLIVVGIDNSSERVHEYTPFKAALDIRNKHYLDTGGLGDLYADFCVKSLKPYIDHKYRTKPGYPYTMIAGSSLGALISVYIAAKYPNVYSSVGVFSLASWFNETAFLDSVSKATLRQDQTYFISIGKKESSLEDDPLFSSIYINNSRNLKKLLEDKDIKSIGYQETDDIHHESNWRKAFPIFISYVFNQR
jgi:predicted alpha/beta superfamily hydrolase